jgi:hypothetical protein
MGDFIFPLKSCRAFFKNLPKQTQRRFVQLAHKRATPSMQNIEGALAQTHTPEESTTYEMFLFALCAPSHEQHYIKITGEQQPPFR